jgi:hypothetical protein
MIVGLSRTGTSLLQRLLNAYPGVIITYESIYRPFLGNNSWDNLHAYYYEVLKQYKHLCLALNSDFPPGSIKPFSFEQEFEYFGDKAIYNTSLMFRKRLSQVVSKGVVKTIFTLRDPRARMLSYFKWEQHRNSAYQYTARSRSYRGDQFTHQELLEIESKAWNQYAADVFKYTNNVTTCMCIKYEQLAMSSVSSIESILNFLDLEPARYPERYLTAINSHSVDRWREELDQNTISQITEITRSYLEKFEYID